MNVLAISSHVAYGHVGNSAAVFALQRLGIEAWPVHTVGYSNHPGHGRYRGTAASGAEIAEIVAGLDDIGALAECDAVLSGYLGRAETGTAVRDAVALVKRRNPRAIYLCDSVMGDSEGGFFVSDDVRKEVILSVAAADIATPNAFEVEILAGIGMQTIDDALLATERLRGSGPDIVVVTSLGHEPGSIATMAAGPDGAWLVTTPRIELGRRADGAGDLLAALFLGHYLDDGDIAAALAAAASSVFGVIEAARAGGHRELPLVAAQSELIAPSRIFEAEALR
jgi:pyridoxine kinase